MVKTQALRVKAEPRITAKQTRAVIGKAVTRHMIDKAVAKVAREKLDEKRVLVRVPRELYDEVMPLLNQRGLSLSDFVRASLRAIPVRMMVYSLSTPLQVGKYRGETLDTVIRMNPKYVQWMLNNTDIFKVDADGYALLTELLNPHTKVRF
jgi:hypothetical protein